MQRSLALGSTNPKVWVVTEDRPGNNTQSIGLAEALVWPFEVKRLQFNVLARLPNRVLGASWLGVRAASRTTLGPPWPDVVIATGRRLAPVARWIRGQSQGRTRLIHLGRKGGHVPERFDLVVACAHFGLPDHPNRLEITIPVNPITRERLAQAAERWPDLFGNAPRPHIALLVGGSSPACQLDVDVARRLGEEVRDVAKQAGGIVHALTSRRTGLGATEALTAGLGQSNLVHPWQPDKQDNPYLGYLATADVLVVTGESESMLAEAAASDKPVYIYALPDRPRTFSGWLREWVVARARERSDENRTRGWPARSLRTLCATIVSHGLILPPRDLQALHQMLYRMGVARPLGAELVTARRPPLNETERVVRRVQVLMGMAQEELQH